MRFFNLFASHRRLAAAGLVCAAALFGAFIGAPFARAAEGQSKTGEVAGLQKGDVEKIIHDYILANPEVVRDAIDELEKRQKAVETSVRERAIAQSGGKLLNSSFQAVIGNPTGDVTLVEFFDYNCGYCKRSLADVQKLVEADPKLRVVLKDFPILGSNSVEAAQVASALREQFKGEKFWEFHKKLLGTRGSIGKAQALAVAKELGADMDRLEKDLKDPKVQDGLKEVADLADQLHFEGTPSWVVGKEAFVGGLPFATLKSKVDNLRKCGATSC